MSEQKKKEEDDARVVTMGEGHHSPTASEAQAGSGEPPTPAQVINKPRQFDRAAVKRWRRAAHKELRLLRMPSEDPAYRAAMICAAVYCFGTDVSVLAEITGQQDSLVRKVLKRMRKTRMLVGQTLRASDGWSGKHGTFGLLLDAMVAAGDLYRPPDEKRSAAMKTRAPITNRAPRKVRVKPEPGSVFSPKVQKSNPLYGLAEWDKK